MPGYLSVTFPGDTSVELPAGTDIRFPGGEPLHLSSRAFLVFQPGGGFDLDTDQGLSVSYPTGGNLSVAPATGESGGLDISDQSGTTVTIPTPEGMASMNNIPVDLSGLFTTQITFPPGTGVQFPEQQAKVVLPSPANVIVRKRRAVRPDFSVIPRNDD
jgi:hypothetical protein